MHRWRWVVWAFWAIAFAVTCLAASARAGDFTEIHVCVRPPNLPPDLAAWAYTPSGAGIAIQRDDFKKRYPGVTVYVFDPAAPAANTLLLPIPYNKLACPARVLPIKPLATPTADPKKADAPKAGGPAAPGGGTDEKKEKAEEKDAPPPGTPAPIAYPNGKPPTPPQLDLSQTRTGTTSILPLIDRNGRGASVLPLLTSEGGGVLPFRRPGTGSIASGAGNGGGTGKGPGVEKTAFEKFAEEIAYGGAVANQQFTENDKRADGKRYGIPSGKNPNGPNSPVAQAAAGSVLIVAAAITAGGFDKKLIAAFRKKVPLLIQGTGKVAEDAAEKFVEGVVAKQGEKGRLFLADVLNKNGAIGEYSVMKKFTDKLGGRVQAHHILEDKFAKRFGLEAGDKVPSVILTEAEHKAITAKLASKTLFVKTPSQLWEVYKEVYQKQTHWLDAIRSYFVKAK